ncbi:restriction endonuclease [Streptomyces sp. NPDC000941]
MAQRRGNSWQSEYERQQQAAHREQVRAQRETARQERAAEAERKRREKERQQAYAAQQVQLATDRTTGVEHEAEQLRQLLREALVADPLVSFDSLRRVHTPRRFVASVPEPGPAPRWEDFAPPEPGGLSAVFGLGRRTYERRLAEEQERFRKAEQRHGRAVAQYREKVDQKQAEHRAEQECEARDVREFNDSLEQRRDMYRAGEPEAVEWFLERALGASAYPPGFPSQRRAAFRPADGSALIEVHLPLEDIVPAARGYTYVKSRDEMKVLPQPEKERKELYASVLAQVALRTLYEVFDCDKDKVVDSIVFNGHVTTVDRATGHEVSPCLITLSTDREQFGKLLLSQVEPAACLKYLNAMISPNPYELEPIRPIVEFDLTKYRLTNVTMDVVAGLDSRPVLTQLTPTEFEHLIRQLFEAIGMEAWNTQPSKDEGVDAIATSRDPIFHGECIIQAKRYAKLVGVESVQALAGVVEHKRAAKGILITTSWFGRASHTFAAQHGRLQLIEGQELVYLIKEHLGKDVIAGPVPPKRRP